MNSNNKVLVFMDWYLPGFRGGGPIRSVSNMLNRLKNHLSFSIITRDSDYCFPIPYENVKSDSWESSPDGLRCYYFSQSTLTFLRLIRLVRKEKWDVLYINGLYSIYFSVVPLLISRIFNYPAIVAPRGMLSSGSMGTRHFRKRFYLILARYLGFFKNAEFHATSQNELEDIKKHFGTSIPAKYAPNLPGDLGGQPAKTTKSKGCVKLVSIARVSPEKNIDFALQLLHEVKGKVEFDVYGSIYDKRYWEACLRIMETLPGNVTVNYKDSLEPAEIRGILKKGDFLLLPTTGENFGHIIFESFSVGTPVIISDQTPWRDLEKKKIGWNIPLSERGEYINKIEYAIGMDDDEYGEMSNNSLNYAREYLNDPMPIKLMREIFQLS